MELAERIKELCEQKGMTVKELSEKSEIPLTTVKRIVSGQTPDPGYTTVIKLFEVLDTNAKDDNAENQLIGVCKKIYFYIQIGG